MTKTETFTSQCDRTEISAMSVIPDEGKPVGIVQIVHGMCEYKERYIPFMNFLAEHGLVCVIHDHRGHGNSVGSDKDLGYFQKGGFEAMVSDTAMITDTIRNRFPRLPVFLLGHSMGSMVARSFVKRHENKIAGLIVCGSPSRDPALKAGIIIARAYSFFMGERSRPAFIRKMAFGKFGSRFPGEVSENSWICSDPKVVEEYDKDPKCNFCFTANGFENLFLLMKDAYDFGSTSVSDHRIPVLFISGENDPCMIDRKRFDSAVGIMKKAGYDVRSIIYPGMRHEILNETGREQVWNDILSMIRKA